MQRFPTYNPHLEIKKSLINGANLGLFAKCDIPAGKLIDVYHGAVYTEKEYQRMEEACSPKQEAKLHEYVLYDDSNRLHIVPWKSDDCYARFSNDVSLQGRVCNATFCDFAFHKDVEKDAESLSHFPSISLQHFPRKATMCIRAAHHIHPGTEIYVCYGNSYWISERARKLKEKLTARKRKFQRVVRAIRKRLDNKQKYLFQKKASSSDVRIAVWPHKKANLFVMAQWSGNTKKASDVLHFDKHTKKWLVLCKKAEPLPHPTTRVAFTECVLPPL